VISRDSANTLFDQTIATFDNDGGAYNQADAGGFIKLNALRMRIAETARRKRAK
jgi:argininosuccinate synthase